MHFVALLACVLIEHANLPAQITSMSPRNVNEQAAEETDTSVTTIGITAFRYEVGAALVGSMLAVGADLRADLFYPFSLGVRLSLDLEYGSLFTIPYLGVTWNGIGGFEVGRLIRPTVSGWIVPYWETWRGWIGDEKKFTLGASVLSNVPLNAVGYYEGGFSVALNDHPDFLWVGLASISDNGRAKGPAAKASFFVGAHTWIQVKASYMFGKEEDGVGTTIATGIRQEF